jgi:hypothetical protein
LEAISTDIDIQPAPSEVLAMYDNVAAWMIAGGPRTEVQDRKDRHIVAIAEAREAVRTDQPSLLDRARVRLGVSNAAPAIDCCVA